MIRILLGHSTQESIKKSQAIAIAADKNNADGTSDGVVTKVEFEISVRQALRTAKISNNAHWSSKADAFKTMGVDRENDLVKQMLSAVIGYEKDSIPTKDAAKNIERLRNQLIEELKGKSGPDLMATASPHNQNCDTVPMLAILHALK